MFHSILQTSRLRFRAPKSCLMERLAFSTRLPNTCSIFWPPFNGTISAAPSQAPFWRNWCLYLLIPPADIYWRPTVCQVWSLREFSAPSSSEGWAPWEEIAEWEKITPNGFLILWCHAMSLLVIKCLSPPWHKFFMPQSIVILCFGNISTYYQNEIFGRSDFGKGYSHSKRQGLFTPDLLFQRSGLRPDPHTEKQSFLLSQMWCEMKPAQICNCFRSQCQAGEGRARAHKHWEQVGSPGGSVYNDKWSAVAPVLERV